MLSSESPRRTSSFDQSLNSIHAEKPHFIKYWLLHPSLLRHLLLILLLRFICSRVCPRIVEVRSVRRYAINVLSSFTRICVWICCLSTSRRVSIQKLGNCQVWDQTKVVARRSYRKVRWGMRSQGQDLLKCAIHHW
jgi:hypothetical protein